MELRLATLGFASTLCLPAFTRDNVLHSGGALRGTYAKLTD